MLLLRIRIQKYNNFLHFCHTHIFKRPSLVLKKSYKHKYPLFNTKIMFWVKESLENELINGIVYKENIMFITRIVWNIQV